jgi:hypothetical protein
LFVVESPKGPSNCPQIFPKIVSENIHEIDQKSVSKIVPKLSPKNCPKNCSQYFHPRIIVLTLVHFELQGALVLGLFVVEIVVVAA